MLTLAVPILLAGCTFPGTGGVGKSFDPIDVPVWEAGYSWTYDVVSSSQSSGFDRDGIGTDGDSERTRVTLTVINTTKESEGRPVYVVALGEGADHPLFDAAVQAITKDTLEVVAVGHQQVQHVAPAARAGEGPCAGQTPLYPVDSDQRFPTLRFPLDDGATWTGSLGLGDPVAMTYTMTAHGLVDVETPAGVFDAVYVTTEFRAPEERSEDLPDDVRFFDLNLRSEQWYSPDARYLVKQVFSASAMAGDEEQRYRYAYRTAAILANFSLEPRPEEPAPDIAGPVETVREPYRPIRIVSDTAFPVNVADGPVAARFTLEDTDGGWPLWEPQIASSEELAPLVYDNTTHELRWTITDSSARHADEQRFTGDILEFQFSKGGDYNIRAGLHPKECGAYQTTEASATATALWSKSFEFETSAGELPQTIDLGVVPVEVGAYEGVVSWDRAPKYGYSTDSGNVALRGPDGRTQTFSTNRAGSGSFSTFPAGEYALSWQSTGLPTIGEDIHVTATVTYSFLDGRTYAQG